MSRRPKTKADGDWLCDIDCRSHACFSEWYARVLGC